MDSALKKDERYYLQVFIKQCKYIEKIVIRNIHDNLSDFSSFDESDGDEEWMFAAFSLLLKYEHTYKV